MSFNQFAPEPERPESEQEWTNRRGRIVVETLYGLGKLIIESLGESRDWNTYYISTQLFRYKAYINADGSLVIGHSWDDENIIELVFSEELWWQGKVDYTFTREEAVIDSGVDILDLNDFRKEYLAETSFAVFTLLTYLEDFYPVGLQGKPVVATAMLIDALEEVVLPCLRDVPDAPKIEFHPDIDNHQFLLEISAFEYFEGTLFFDSYSRHPYVGNLHSVNFDNPSSVFQAGVSLIHSFEDEPWKKQDVLVAAREQFNFHATSGLRLAVDVVGQFNIMMEEITTEGEVYTFNLDQSGFIPAELLEAAITLVKRLLLGEFE